MVGKMTPLLLIAILVVASSACNLPFLRQPALLPPSEDEENFPAEEPPESKVDEIEVDATGAGTAEEASSQAESPSPSPRPGIEEQNGTTTATRTATPTASYTPTARPTVPTSTPRPSNTPKPTSPPSDTPKPTSTPSVTPTLTPEPTDTPEPRPPAAPEGLDVLRWVCNSDEHTVAIGWKDVAEDEDGYRVYRDDKLIETLKAETESFTDKPPYTRSHTYGVEAFNEAGSSKRPTIEVDGCIY